MAFDPTDDYRLFDFTQTVTHTQMPSGTTDSVAGVLKQALQLRDAAGNAILSVDEVQFFIPGAELANAIDRGDTLTEADSTVWSILDLGYDPATRKYVARCVKERS